jgi:4-amino-4-deoxy-L-arabinose transferase-like glycosyltransferase
MQPTTKNHRDGVPAWIWLLLALTLGAFSLWHIRTPLPTDVAYLLTAAQRLFHGEVLYQDILETNPPLILWIKTPIAWVAEMSGADVQIVFVLFLSSICAGVLWLANAIARTLGFNGSETAALLCGVSVVMFALPAVSYGQREHLATILFIPYLTSASALVLKKKGLPTTLALTAGLLAGLAVSFKPYFALIPLLVEAALLVSRKHWRLVFRIENLAMGLVVVAYPVLVWLIAPAYFKEITPLLLLTYSALDRPFGEVLARTNSILTIATFLLSVLVLAASGTWRIGLIWLAASAGAYLAYLIQSKGFAYHPLPALSFAIVSVAVQFPLSTPPFRFAISVFVIALLVGLQVLNFREQNFRQLVLTTLLESQKPGTIMALSFDHGLIFPYPQKGWRWTGRFHSIWTLPAVAKSMLEPDERDMVVGLTGRIVAEDLERAPPEYVIVDNRVDDAILRGNALDYIGLLSETPAFVASWKHYERVRVQGSLELWRRKSIPSD